jgi:hypothetical protein
MTSLFLAVILAWDPSPTPGVNYRLYYGPNSGQQTIFVDVGKSTVAEVKDEDLPPGFRSISLPGHILGYARVDLRMKWSIRPRHRILLRPGSSLRSPTCV